MVGLIYNFNKIRARAIFTSPTGKQSTVNQDSHFIHVLELQTPDILFKKKKIHHTSMEAAGFFFFFFHNSNMNS